jgi:hypothetical protein
VLFLSLQRLVNLAGANFTDTENISGFLKEICVMEEVLFVGRRELF